MKKVLLALLLSCLAIVSVRADVLFNEQFIYANGPIIVNGTNADGSTNWFRHSGSASPSDSVVKNGRLEVASSSPGVVPRQDDVHRNFTSFTNSQTLLYASFIVNCTNLPPAVGTYFAHFYVNSTTFHGRVFAQAGSLAGTWRLGIAGAAGTVSAVVPVDLATNTDYQVVVRWDPVTSFSAQIWVNPLAESDPFAKSTDAVSAPAAATGFGFRQGGTFGNAFFNVDNLVAATAFDEAATNTLATNAVAPVIVYQPKGNTNFAFNTFSISAVAAGQGLGNMQYQWVKDDVFVSNPLGNSNVWTFNNAQPGDSGNYQVIATTPFGLSATSIVASVLVTNSTIPPIITKQPASNTVAYAHSTVTLVVTAIGPPPISYNWKFNGGPVTYAGATDDGAGTLTLTDVQTNNGAAGTYRCEVANGNGTNISSNAVVVVTNPPAASIAFLRTLVSPVSFVPTNSTSLYTATGIITTYTNTTSGNTASYYLQDGTGGINIFATFASTWRPAIGDEVAFVGFLSSFQGVLELTADLQNNLSTSATVLSNNIANMPNPKVISWDSLATNNNANIEYNLEGSLVMLTNVYFGTNAGTVTTAANLNCLVTNASGKVGYVYFFAAQINELTNQTIPAFAYAVVGPLTQATNVHDGYQVIPTRWADVVTTVPAISLDTPVDGANFTAPASITLAATVTSNGYPISAVNFYQGASLITSVTTPPYTYAWTGVGAGSYALTAKAVYSLYGTSFTAVSGTNTVTVTQPIAPVSSVTIAPGAGNSINISYAGGSASHFVLIGTNNITAPLATWPVIQTTNGTTPATFNVPIGSATQMYYKIQSE